MQVTDFSDAFCPQELAGMPQLGLMPLAQQHLDAVLAIEQAVQAHPWTRGHFASALEAGNWMPGLMAQGQLLGYLVAMPGVQEAHLLNLAVAPGCQGRGLAGVLLQALALWARGQGAACVWLEARVGNERALRVYRRCGFVQAGLRRDYYPAAGQQREDAAVMRLAL